MLTFRVRAFAAALGFLAFALVYVAVGIRWHGYRAQASYYARQEVDHSFKAGDFARAARDPGDSDDAPRRAVQYRKFASMHAKAAEECARLREFYERAW